MYDSINDYHILSTNSRVRILNPLLGHGADHCLSLASNVRRNREKGLSVLSTGDISETKSPGFSQIRHAGK